MREQLEALAHAAGAWLTEQWEQIEPTVGPIIGYAVMALLAVGFLTSMLGSDGGGKGKRKGKRHG